MKPVNLSRKFLLADMIEAISFVWLQWRKHKLPLILFIALSVNLIIAPVVYATAEGTLERRSAWAIGILGLVTLALIIYLFFVVFQPERF
ncbi:K(+)-transporting ATPase subunit F [Chlorogloeopsis sp. ULAP01]|uniref:K(+)-transporting ATPase subunit F n=1 Tax=Chlorogloeopsis sp. ULAP01 TaxID=3056483 RepID=UPI0025AB1CA6|nr:K(+)-transporting ATPase subunit F [Chlorogloeopsis sp. ULAP01]MDM9384217.1 K(+)-transporting ATPase subunit F [Chlorogloeopsis sp. ULAP01]